MKQYKWMTASLFIMAASAQVISAQNATPPGGAAPSPTGQVTGNPKGHTQPGTGQSQPAAAQGTITPPGGAVPSPAGQVIGNPKGLTQPGVGKTQPPTVQGTITPTGGLVPSPTGQMTGNPTGPSQPGTAQTPAGVQGSNSTQTNLATPANAQRQSYIRIYVPNEPVVIQPLLTTQVQPNWQGTTGPTGGLVPGGAVPSPAGQLNGNVLGTTQPSVIQTQTGSQNRVANLNVVQTSGGVVPTPAGQLNGIPPGPIQPGVVPLQSNSQVIGSTPSGQIIMNGNGYVVATPAAGQTQLSEFPGRVIVPGQQTFGAINSNAWFMNQDVRTQLSLTPQQITQLNQQYAELYGRYQGSMAQYNSNSTVNGDPRNSFINANQFYSTLNNTANSILTPEQRMRFQQLALQYRGYQAFNDPAISERLQLTADQRAKLSGYEQVYDDQLKYAYLIRSVDPSVLPARISFLRQEMNDRINSVLTEPQQQAWRYLLGSPFNFSLEQ